MVSQIKIKTLRSFHQLKLYEDFFFWGGIFGFNLDAKTRREKKKQFQEIKKLFFYKKRKISFVGVTAAMNILNMTFFGKIASEFFSLEIF